MIPLIFLATAALFAAAYFLYGARLDRLFGVDDTRPTPSHADYDGVDRVPAHPAVLFGHHFSSIAGAGPIVGPIIAAAAFGWLPPLLWILLGAVFVGGVHDYTALLASIRHRGRSIAEIAREYMSPLAYRLLLAFIWLSLVYVLTVFTDLTATTFVERGAVATSSFLFVVLAVGFGLAVYRFKVSVLKASLVFVPLVFVSVWLGQLLPLDATSVPALLGSPAKTWCLVLVAYCFLASTLPVWILLQPRDYLSAYLLYASVAGSVAGVLFGGIVLQYPAFKGWSAAGLGALFPALFITVACGACSGFHSVVASGTSSKQLDRESHARPVAFGGMLVEGLVAVVAVVAVAMLAADDPLTAKPPLVVYGTAMGRFLSVFGLPPEIGFDFGLLALSCFILTTLDTATRLGRYIFEEFFERRGGAWSFAATAATLALPTVFVLITLRDPAGNPLPAWKAVWPVFGATNQLLAGLALLVVTLWLRKTGRPAAFAFWPMTFMLAMTLWALAGLVGHYRPSTVIGGVASLLLLLAALVIAEAVRALRASAR